MAKWLPPMVLIVVLRTTSSESDGQACRTHFSALRWPQLSCTNVNTDYFANFTRPLNRTHWIKCSNCTLHEIDERTFNFPKNNISYLELSENRILSLKKFAFNRFFLLKLLNLKRNGIEYLEPKCFAGLKRLFHLDLSFNCLKILTTNIFAELANLDVLNLNRNEIFYIQPYAFAGLTNLKYLYLNNNDLKKLEDKMFKSLTNLKILYIEHNNIGEIHQNAFANLINLNYLYLNNNSISFLVQYNFKPLTSLVDLQLRLNKLNEIQVSSFNGLKNLRFLYLGSNNISYVKPYGFIGLDSLVVLDLTKNSFKSIDFAYFDKISNLDVLWLNDNLIADIDINPKHEVQNRLEVIDLSVNDISQFNYSLLYSKIPNMKEIVLANNSLSCDFFNNMYNFYADRNVSVCISFSCSSNDTIAYIEKICSKPYLSTVTDIEFNTTDYSTTACAPITNTHILNYYIYFYTALYFIIIFC